MLNVMTNVMTYRLHILKADAEQGMSDHARRADDLGGRILRQVELMGMQTKSGETSQLKYGEVLPPSAASTALNRVTSVSNSEGAKRIRTGYSCEGRQEQNGTGLKRTTNLD